MLAKYSRNKKKMLKKKLRRHQGCHTSSKSTVSVFHWALRAALCMLTKWKLFYSFTAGWVPISLYDILLAIIRDVCAMRVDALNNNKQQKAMARQGI